MITVVTKPDSVVVTDSKYSRDDLPLPSFGAKIRGKIERGEFTPNMGFNHLLYNLSIDQDSFWSVSICFDGATAS